MKRINYYVSGSRLFEWVTSIPVAITGIVIFAWPQITHAPAFRYFEWFVPSWVIGLIFLSCGLNCILALLVNGASWEVGPRVRSWMALIRALIFFQFGLSTVQAGFEQGYPFVVTPFWFCLALGELYVAYRAVLDVRTD